MPGWFGLLLALLLFIPLSNARAGADATPGAAAFAAARQILDKAKAEAAQGCRRPSDVLVHILCNGQLRIGLRTYYPGFSVRKDNSSFAGFEWDVAQRIAEFIGVRPVGVAVDPKNRIPMVADGRIDLVIATMGHDTLRDKEVRFIRPHYYMSQTAIVGAKDNVVADWQALGGRTVCLPLGSSTNIVFIRHHVQVLTFDRPEQLLDALSFGECAFIVQDDTFFRQFLTDPAWSSRFQIMFGFAPLPWGMAVARTDTDQLAALLDLLSAAFHADGVFLQLARAHDLDLAFLQAQQQRWSSPGCAMPNGVPPNACLIPATDHISTASADSSAPHDKWLDESLFGWLDLGFDLSLLTSPLTSRLLLEGIAYSLALIAGSQLATAAFALILGRLMGTGPAVLRLGFGALTFVGQTAPLPLLLFFGYIVAGGLTPYSGRIALLVAILVIGFYNGCNAGRAIHEAHQTLLQRQSSPEGRRRSFRYAVSIAGVQIVAFLINAAKGSPAAGMIGVPEFLNVVTDLTSYSSDRIAVYLILLIFYTSLVLLVIVLLSAGQERLERRTGRFP